MTWKALSPRGEICLVVDLGEKKLVKSNRKGEGGFYGSSRVKFDVSSVGLQGVWDHGWMGGRTATRKKLERGAGLQDVWDRGWMEGRIVTRRRMEREMREKYDSSCACLICTYRDCVHKL